MARRPARASSHAVCGVSALVKGGSTPFESGAELAAHTILSADIETTDMGAQLGPYFYFDGLGNRRKHYFDAETIGPNGEWCLYAVKSRLSSKYAVTVEILKRLHEDDERLAEATLHIVDEDCRKVWQVQRARLVLTARQFVDDDAEAAVLACLASEDREFTVAEVDERTALDHRTLYAVARLYWKRRVTVRDGLFLDYAAHIRAA